MSSEVQRLIRKLRPKGPRSFDEQVWPIYVALIVLFGYLAGVIVSVLRFNDNRIHANAVTWLVVLLVIGIAGLFAVRMLQERLLKRTIVLSLLLSLIINISLLIMMAWTSIQNAPWRENETKTAVTEQREEVIVPEYPLYNEDPQQRVRQEYERPVETGEPEAEKRIELTRQSTVPEIEMTERPPVPNTSQDQKQVTATPRRFEAPSAPRQSQTTSKLSRQKLRSELTVNNAATVPNQQSQQQASRQQQANVTPTTPQKVQPQRERQDVATEQQQAPTQVEVAKLSRSEATETDTPSNASLPTLKRSLKRPKQLPSTDTPLADTLTTSERTERSAEPNSTLVEKTKTSAPEQMTQVDLQPKVAVNLQRQTRIDRPDSPTLSPSTERASLAKSASSSTDVEAPNPNESPSKSEQSDAAASNSQLAKQSNPNNVESSEAAQPQQVQSKAQPTASTVARAKSTSEPSLSETLADRKSPTRAKIAATKTTQTMADVSGAVSAMSNLTNPAPAAEASRMALSRSAIGVAGVGDAANLERGLPAPDSPISIASASANRAEAEQELEEAFALSPSAPSPARQMRATANQPRTSMQAQPIDTAMVPGATAPAEATASAAATLERSPSNAASSSVTAAKGTTEIDLGPTRIAADTGSGRAEGGGQPEISTGEVPRALARSNALAGNSGSPTSIDTTATSPPAEDLAGESDIASNSATASTSELAQGATGGAPSASGGKSNVEPTSSNDAPNIVAAGGSRADDESDSTMPAAQLAAGGNSRPGRRARGLKVKSETVSSVPSLASTEESGGSSRGEPLDANNSGPKRTSAGLPGTMADDIGAAAAEEVATGQPTGLDTPMFTRNETSGGGDEGSFALTDTNRGAPRRSRRSAIAGGSTDVELDPEEFAINAPSTSEDDGLDTSGLDGELVASVNRQSGGALEVDIDAADDIGGLGDDPAPNAGIFSRKASPDSEFVSLQPSRFRRSTRPGASIKSDTEVVLAPTKAFRRRVIRQGEELAGERGLPSPKTEAAIELGLVFLAKYQSSDGSWSLNNFADGKAELPKDEEAIIVSDTAATGLSLLSFLGAGYHHKADKYQEHVKNGLDFLVQHQREDGDLYIDQDANSSRSAWLYSHAIAAIALCEAYGMTQDPELRGPAQKAVNFIGESQHPQRGGWRYSPEYGSDTSVTGWMTMALKSGELAGLTVDKESFEKIEKWVTLAQGSDEQPFLFRYNPYALDTPKQRHGLKPTRAMTAVGLLIRLYTGWERDDSRMILGAQTLNNNLPETGTSDRPRRDTYYWYYATQVMYHMGGDYWTQWNQALHPMLTKSQLQDGPLAGSWDPQMPVPDRWGTYGGRLYVTTMNLLSLEVFYRHLPIYEDTAK